MKKVLSVILTICMLISVVAITASAEEISIDDVLPEGYTEYGTCGENAYWGYYEDTKTLIIGGEGVTVRSEYSKRQFEYAELDFEKAIVLEGITGLDSYAFANCGNMTEVSLPDSLIKIYDSAFANCKNLKSVTIPKNVDYLGLYLFYLCESLEEIKVDPENTTFDSRDNCNGIIITTGNQLRNACKNTAIPESVTNIGAYTYYGVAGITEIIIPESVTDIYESAFQECADLKSVSLPSGLIRINTSLFLKCDNLESISIPDGVAVIGPQAFSGCSALESIEIPASVKWIEQSAFNGCTNLSTVVIADGVGNIAPNAFAKCTSIKEIAIPESVVNIQGGAFWGCTGLEIVTIYNRECVIGDMDITFPENAVIYGYEGSTAQAYAENYNREFVALPEPEYAVGDVDLDGEISVIDATRIQRFIAQIEIWKYEKITELADVDNDGEISVMDATAIQRYIAGLE